MTNRPGAVASETQFADDGLYGPDSVTWRVMASPTTGIAATAAAMIQMLYPPVMYVIDQASGFREQPQRRAQRTGDYTVTITYGDIASAEQAGASLRRLHTTRKAVDPSTGQQYRADDPDLLVWVHNSLTWALLRAYREYGPELTSTEEDRFVAEQRAVAGRLVGCDLAQLPEDVAGLQTYMDSMTPKLALSTPALWFRDLVVPPGRAKSAEQAVTALFAKASIGIMAPEHRELYGFREGALKQAFVSRSVKLILAGINSKVPVEKAVPQLREYVDTHAFGSRRVKLVDPAAVGEGS